MNDKSTPFKEENISALLDGELDEIKSKAVEGQLDNNSELKELANDFKESSELFKLYKDQEVDSPNWNQFWSELDDRISHEKQIATTDNLNSKDLLKIIMESRKVPSLWERLFSGFIPAAVGAAVAIAVIMFITKTSNKSNEPQRSVAINHTNTTLALNKKPIQPNIKNVSVKPDISHKKIVPNSNITSILHTNDTCVIESMNAVDDNITTVFKVADTDGSMITVIWLPIEEEGKVI